MVEPEDHDPRRVKVEEVKEEFSQTSNGRAARKIPKRALAASALSFLAPGVGQAFNGDWKGAAPWGIATPVLIFISSPAHLTATFLGFISCIALQLLVSAFSARNAFRWAIRHARTNRPEWKAWLKRLGAVALAGVLIGAMDFAAISSATIRPYKISTPSMAPTIAVGDRIAVDLRYYNHHIPQRGEVVALKAPNGLLLVKRVAALGGDVVEGREGRVLVNGKAFDDRHRVEAHEMGALSKRIMEFGPETVPPGKFFVLGDNRGHSWDSRSPDFGPVDRTDIKGKVLYAYWSKDLSRTGKRVE
jgi:signal peptidase I